MKIPKLLHVILPLCTAMIFILGGSLHAARQGQAAAAKRGVTPEDYFAFQFAGDPHLSHDGKSVAFVVTTVDQRRNRRDSAIWLVPADGSAAPRRLTASGTSANSPR